MLQSVVKPFHLRRPHSTTDRGRVPTGAKPELPQHFTLPSPLVLAVRSCHLPHDHTATAMQDYAADLFKFCAERVLKKVGSGAYTEEERRWRHAEHMLCGCPDVLYLLHIRRGSFVTLRCCRRYGEIRRRCSRARRQPL